MQTVKDVIFCAIYGDYDNVKNPVPQNHEVDFLLFTDNQSLLERTDLLWKVIYRPLNVGNPRMNAKMIKLMPHLFLEAYNRSIWVDGQVEIKSPSFAKTCFDYLPENGNGFTVIPHWMDRDCVYLEYEASMAQEKYRITNATQQIEYYRTQGCPSHAGLYGCTTVIRYHHWKKVKELDLAWWNENLIWSHMDQLSLPYVVWKMNFKPDLIPYPVWINMINLYHHNRND